MAKQEKRVIVLTGAGRGLGRAMADKFKALGHTVLGCARKSADVEKLNKEFGPAHDFAVVDVSSWEQVHAWAKRLIKGFGPPDLLLNNAAVMTDKAPLWEVPVEEFDRLIDINIKGVANVVRAFAPAMVERAEGVIVNFSSGWGRSTAADVAPYCASKYAIEGLTLALAKELPKGMAAVPLNPGIIDTDMLRSAFGEGAGNYPSPAKWAEKAVPFLLGLGAGDNGKSLNV